MTPLHRVLYCSRNTIPGTPDEVAAAIEQILATSRYNNARDGVTGGLIYSAGCFAQVLEGPLDAVQATFERIQCDQRHSSVAVLDSAPIEVRDFADWSMAYQGPSAVGHELAAAALRQAFDARTAAAEGIMRILRSVITNEEDWVDFVPVHAATTA